jgi:hypothetical protein
MNKTISGTEALARMRKMRHDADSWFTMQHLTWNDAQQQTKGMRTVARCRLRPALPDEAMRRPSDMYLPYTDLDLNENRMAYRHLIRTVAFPPEFETLHINWLAP